MQLVTKYKWWIVGGGLAVAVVGFLLFRPDKIFVDDTVDESLADAFTTTTVVAESTANDDAAGSDDESADASSAGGSEDVAAASDDGDTPTTTTQPPATEEQSEPVSIAGGEWRGIDHFAEGTVGIYEQDGNYVLRFEDDSNFQNGPDLYVWVLADEDYTGGTPSDFIDLGKIKGNVGGQNYALPAEYDPDVHQSVLIWCLRFAVPFAAAPLA